MNFLFFKSTAVLAGGENYVLEIMRAVREADGGAYLATDFLPLKEKARKEGFKAVHFFYGHEAGNQRDGILFILKFPWYHLKTFLFLLKAKMKWRIDTVILSNINEKILITPLVRLLGMKVFWVENLLWRPYLARNPLFIFYRLFYHLISNLIVASEFSKKEIIELGFAPKKIKVLYFGVFTNSQFAIRNLPIKTIGTVARLHREKGLIYLIFAFGKLQKKFPRLKLLIVGDGPEKENLHKQVREDEVKNVEFAGYQESLEKFYKRMDIFVLPSLRDNFPLAILEAMSFGLPVIASNVGGVSEIIENGESGILVKAGDTQGLKNAIEKLLKDDKLRQKIARAGYETAKKFSRKKMHKKIAKIWI